MARFTDTNRSNWHSIEYRQRVANKDHLNSSDRASQHDYFFAFDGIRALAVIAVATWHVGSTWLPRLQGNRGVTTFFALSGFLITTILLREEQRSGSVNIRAFMIRRAFRILPLYFVALTTYVVSDVFIYRSSELTSRWREYWPLYFTFMQDIPGPLGWPRAPFGVAWSLAVEEKFYLIWPIIAFKVLRHRARIVSASIGVAVLGLSIVLLESTRTVALMRPYFPVLCGCLLAFVLHFQCINERIRRMEIKWWRRGLGVAVCIPWAAPNSAVSFIGYSLLSCLLVAAFSIGNESTWLTNRYISWIGRRSYAIYLFHVLLIRVLGRTPLPPFCGEVTRQLTILIGALVASAMIAEVLHKVVEIPMIAIGKGLALRTSAGMRPSDGASLR